MRINRLCPVHGVWWRTDSETSVDNLILWKHGEAGAMACHTHVRKCDEILDNEIDLSDDPDWERTDKDAPKAGWGER